MSLFSFPSDLSVLLPEDALATLFEANQENLTKALESCCNATLDVILLTSEGDENLEEGQVMISAGEPSPPWSAVSWLFGAVGGAPPVAILAIVIGMLVARHR